MGKLPRVIQSNQNSKCAQELPLKPLTLNKPAAISQLKCLVFVYSSSFCENVENAFTRCGGQVWLDILGTKDAWFINSQNYTWTFSRLFQRFSRFFNNIIIRLPESPCTLVMENRFSSEARYTLDFSFTCIQD